MVTLLILAVLVGTILFLGFFRAEGLAAIYVIGLPLIVFISEKFGLPWSTVLSGAIYPVVGLPLLAWWLWSNPEASAPYVPRRIGLGIMVALALVAFWEILYWVQRGSSGVATPYEHYKWAYVLARWGFPIILGCAFPLEVKRLRRLLAAVATMAVITSSIIVLSRITGQHDFSAWGDRYTPVERIGGLALAISCSFGVGMMAAYIYLCNQQSKSTKRTLLISLCMALATTAILLTGSRGPLVAAAGVTLVMMLLSGSKQFFRLAIGIAAAGLLLFFTWSLLPEATLRRLFGEGGYGLEGGVAVRLQLIRSSFRILEISPLYGQTINLFDLLGMQYAHNITLQFMVEMGLIGLLGYLIVMGSAVGGCILALRSGTGTFNRVIGGTLLICFAEPFLEAHSAGDITSEGLWLVVGIMMGHRLRQVVWPAEAEPPLAYATEYDLAQQARATWGNA